MIRAWVTAVGAVPILRKLIELLDPEEWVVFGKLIGIAGLLWLLIQARIALQYPAEMFLYGRF